MNNGIPTAPAPVNEPVRSYAPGTNERLSLQRRLQAMRNEDVEIPALIGGREVRSGRTAPVVMPHEHGHRLGTVHLCGAEEIEMAIKASQEAWREWSSWHWTDRAAVFLKAADLLAGPWRDTVNAATMLGQSKNAYQAEIDSACELIDFFRFNVHFMERIYADQPLSGSGTWNRMEYRPLEGFVFAVAPFNFTSISGNLPTAPALLGNVVLWKPATTAVLSSYYIYRLLEEAGLPPGVLNMVPGRGPDVGGPALAHRRLAGLHFTGSTQTFQYMWRTIGEHIGEYAGYPRIVGETGGKDFILVHPSADIQAAATALVRGGFEYQGQKCSAASRVYVPVSRWSAFRDEMERQLAELRMGGVEDFSNFINAVIDRSAYDSIVAYIDRATDDGVEVISGGRYESETGYFIEPTVLKVDDPGYRTMCEEIFGPVVSVYVYDDQRYEETLDVIERTSPYALTGAVFSQDRQAVSRAAERLMYAAGNFYINDKPTGAVVGQQPFGGARASGTNDKAGSVLNLLRWTSARSIKETFVPARDYRYPFLSADESTRTGSGDGEASTSTTRSAP